MEIDYSSSSYNMDPVCRPDSSIEPDKVQRETLFLIHEYLSKQPAFANIADQLNEAMVCVLSIKK